MARDAQDLARATGPEPLGRTEVVLWDRDEGIGVVDVDLPAPAAREVVVRVDLATVCGSDRRTIAGRRPAPSPSVLGHEAVGHVVAVGAGAVDVDGDPLVVGDRVVWGVTVSCGHCDRCTSGRTAKCRTLRKIGHEPFLSGWPLSGSYARHVLLPWGTALARVPASIADAAAAPIACATATVVAAVEAAGAVVGRRALVSGAGMLGLAAVVALVDAGATEVAVTDPDPERRALALAFGASSTHDTDESLPEVDVVIEVSGVAGAIARALAAVEVGGTLVLVGSVTPGPTIALDPQRLVRGGQTIRGVHNYEPRHLRDAVALVARTDGPAPWSDLVDPPVPLDRAVDVLLSPPGVRPRAAIRP